MKLSEVTAEDLPRGREQALAAFKSMPLPKNTEQRWRYTRIDAMDIDGKEYDPAPEIRLELTSLTGGPWSSELVSVVEKAILERPEDKLDAMHQSFLNKAYQVEVKGDAGPIRIAVHAEGRSAFVHLDIRMLERASARLLLEEDMKVNIGSFYLSLSLKAGAKLHMSSLSKTGKDALVFSKKVAHLDAGSELEWVEGHFPEGIVRSNVQMHFQGEGSRGHLKTVFIGKRQEQVLLLQEAIHSAEHTDGDIKNRGIISGKAYSVFQGRIIIDRKAKDTSSFLDDKTLTFSASAKANTIPSLEIDNNDVRASHASTIGMIDEEKLFYMMSRGLSKEDAEHLIIEGFLEEMLVGVTDRETYKRFQERIAATIGDVHA